MELLDSDDVTYDLKRKGKIVIKNNKDSRYPSLFELHVVYTSDEVVDEKEVMLDVEAITDDFGNDYISTVIAAAVGKIIQFLDHVEEHNPEMVCNMQFSRN